MEPGIVFMMVFLMRELFEDRSYHVPEVTWLVTARQEEHFSEVRCSSVAWVAGLQDAL